MEELGERWREVVEQVAGDAASAGVSLHLAAARPGTDDLDAPAPAPASAVPACAEARTDEAEDEDALRRLLSVARRKFGAPLLRVGSASELGVRIDAMLESPRLGHLTRASADFLTAGVISTANRARPTAQDRAVFGDAAAAIGKGLRLAGASAAAYRRLASAHGAAPGATGLAAPMPDPYALIVSPGVPPSVSRLLIASFRGTPAILALAEARRLKRAVAPWLADALAAYWLDGQRAALRFLASVPEARVSERLVPLADRLNFAALDRMMAAYRRRSEARHQRAEAAGFPLHRV